MPLDHDQRYALVRHAADLSGDELVAVWQDLHRAHALVLNPATTEIRMANPFSAVQTAYRVEAAGRWWYGNCAWDAAGICAALHVDGRIETSCPDCGETIALEVRNQRVDDERLLFHCLVPARHWWDDNHLHLKLDEPLPVGRAHQTVARRMRTGSHDRPG